MTEIIPNGQNYPRSLLTDVTAQPRAQASKQITIQDVRAKFPQYGKVSDGDLLVGLYTSKYADKMHIKDFLAAIDGGMFAVQKTGTDLTRTKFIDSVSKPMSGETSAQTDIRLGGSALGPVGDPGGMGMNAVRNAFQGATFGAGDEMVAAGASMMGKGSYQDNLNRERDRLLIGRGQFPKSSFASELAGGAAIGSLAAPVVGAGGKIAQSLRAGAAGAAGGAAYALGTGQGGLSSRASGVPLGAALGATGGIIAPSLVSGAAKTGRAISRVIAPNAAREGMGFGNNAMADRKIYDMLIESMRGGAPHPKSSNYGSAMMLGDVLDGGATMNGIVRSSGQGRDAIVSALKERQLGQGQRVIQGVEDALGTSGTARKYAAKLTSGRKVVANFDYNLARQQAGNVRPSVIIAKLDKFANPKGVTGDIPLGTGKTKISKIMKKYKKMLINKKGEMVTNYDTLLEVRKSMSDQAYSLRGKHGYAAGELGKMVKEMDAMLSQSSPSYKKALDNFREESKIIDAVKLGSDMTNPTAYRSADSLAEFRKTSAPRTPSGGVFKPPRPTNVSPTSDLYMQRAYEDAKLLGDRRANAVRSGYSSRVLGKIESQRPYADKTAALVRGNLKTNTDLMGMAKDPRGLAKVLTEENAMHNTFKRVTGGSQTADNASDILKIENIDPSILGALIRGKPVTAAMNAARGAGNMASGSNSGFRDALAQRLLATGDKMDAVLAMALKRGQRLNKRQAAHVSTLVGAANSGMNGR